MPNTQESEKSHYLKFLPNIFQEPDGFLNDFLKGFESILSRNVPPEMNDYKFKPIEEVINKIEDYYDSNQTPAQFLSWLGSWLDFNIKRGDDYNHTLDIKERDNYTGQIPSLSQFEARSSWNRDLLGNIFNLYLKRSTRSGLEDYLDFYKNNASYYCKMDNQTKNCIKVKPIFEYNIYEFLNPFIIVDSPDSKNEGLIVGQTTVVNERDPNCYWIDISIKHNNLELIQKIERDLVNLLNEEKPAHTYFYLTATVDMMKIQPDNILGYNTFIGGRYEVV